MTWAEALAGAALLMEEMMMEEGASGQGTTPSHQRLQDALKNVCVRRPLRTIGLQSSCH